jgi:hypothetical protein
MRMLRNIYQVKELRFDTLNIIHRHNIKYFKYFLREKVKSCIPTFCDFLCSFYGTHSSTIGLEVPFIVI